MNVAGFLVTLLNISSFEDHGIPIEDIAVKVAEVGNIKNELIYENKFNLEDFRETGYYRRGNVGRYMSQSCRDYFYNDNDVPSTDEGVCISLFFGDSPRPSSCQDNQYQNYGNGYSDDQANYLNGWNARRKRDIRMK